MLIHSVTPPHMLNEQNPYPEMTCKSFDGGFLEGFDTSQGFQLTRMSSTNPQMYLKKELAPGAYYCEGRR